jgi:hypothetical protein
MRNTTLRCKRKCAYNDSGVCFFPGEIIIGVRCKQYIHEEDKPKPEMPKDYEDPACSSGRRCWVTARFYGRSENEVIRKKIKYQLKYPMEGYSTYDYNPISKTVNGFYCAAIMRYSTCD